MTANSELKVGDNVRTTVPLRSFFLGELPVGAIGTVGKPYDIRENYLIVEFATPVGVTGFMPLPDFDEGALELIEALAATNAALTPSAPVRTEATAIPYADQMSDVDWLDELHAFATKHAPVGHETLLNRSEMAIDNVSKEIARLTAELERVNARVRDALAINPMEEVKGRVVMARIWNEARDEFRSKLLAESEEK